MAAQPLTSTNIEALIEGGVSGQVAVGNQNVQIHADHGAVVFMTPQGTQPAPKLRSLPILQRPRRARGLLDRQADIAAALTAIGTSLPVGIHGAPGIGKSTLLRHLAYAVEIGSLPDGVIHLSARQQPAEDILQSLFEAFYQCDAPFKPTPSQTRQFLQGKKAFVLLDDAELGREAAEDLLDSAPDCAFVLAAQERCLWGECRPIGLGGLPAADARALFERELGRSLTAEEAPAFESLYARLDGHPLHLLQAAAEMREGRPIAEPALIDEGSGRQALASMSEDQRRILSALAAVGGGPVGAAHVAALAKVADPLPLLDSLIERKLVQAHSPRYSLTGNLPDLLPKFLDLTPWREQALGYFIGWAEAHQGEPAALLEEAGVLQRLLDWAAETGRHAEAARLGRALDTALAVTGRWGAWEQSLERVRGAAKALGDRTTEGWALHQLGTRRLCLDDKTEARRLLTEALAIREALGDRAGAAVTRHNLGLLGAPPQSESPGDKGPRSALRLLPWIGGALLILILGGIGLRSFWSGQQNRTVEPIASDMESPSIETETPLVSAEETSDLTTTDHFDTTDFEVPQSLKFPTMELGSQTGSRVETISVTNTGTTPIRVAGVSFTENPGQAFSRKSDCGHIPAGGQCSVQVAFDPPKAGTYRAVLAIDVAGLKQRLVEISGKASESPICLTLSPPQGLNFGDLPVGKSQPLEVTITNCGTAPRRVGVSARGENAEEFAIDATCSGRPLDPGKACAVTVTFTPTSPGKRELRLTVTDRTAGIEQALPLRGTALGWCCIDGKISSASEADCKDGGTFFKDRASIVCPPLHPEIELSPRRGLHFREVEVGKSSSLPVTVRNTGNAPLKIDTISLSERTRELVIDKGCSGEVLLPEKTCSFHVIFTPATPGKRDLKVTVTDRTAGVESFLPVRGTAFAAPPLGWCCIDGKISEVSISEADCTARRGEFFNDQKEALSTCQPYGCCVKGEFMRGLTQCDAIGGTYMTEKEASSRCKKEETVWCCLPGGSPFRTTRERCKSQQGSLYFETEKEALRNCKPIG